ncbi:MAG: hypothetical protein QN141_13070 [Armatimonadota bacterium]|nr:hypothetical protein [Armatimonadota bacterium]MDR7452176.1 hypothetical protein [Armatimonadota bacterium]MDR7494902.1 hypothetical protein [Armatimonadota bacterium]MDR7500299.1 hypothetical protein [Armatimonadota bacterium]MDR7505552.1 hypothetical protein [Armatimonadota bacterium]
MTIAAPSGRVLAYADRLAVYPVPSGGGAVGLGGVAFAPGVLELLGRKGIAAVVMSRGAVRLRLDGLRLSFHAGEARIPEGGWVCDAAVGTYRTLVRPGQGRRRIRRQ